MSDYKATDTEFQSVANAIRTKGGTQAQLEWPTEFVSAIQNIPSGGGSPGIYTGTDNPTSSLGNNGDYYYKFEIHDKGILSNFPNNQPSSQSIAGWEFYPNEDCVIAGVSGYGNNTDGIIRLSLADGTVVKEVETHFQAGVMTNVLFESPITLLKDVHYIIQAIHTGIKFFQQHHIVTDERITFVQGRYGGTPGVSESGTAYSVNILFDEVTNYIKNQYIKINGSWKEIP